MLKVFSKVILKLIGWHADVTLPEEKKYVMIGAPHTTNWDLPIGLLCFWSASIRLTWVGKKQLFIGPFDYLFRALGGIPVDRSVHTGFIDQIAHQFDSRDEMIFGLTPEGTRSRTEYWKTGFYYIALKAKVPICLAYVDFPSRTIGFGKTFIPTGDIDKDFEIIKSFYQDKTGKCPEHQGPIRIRKK
ncbi:MAG: lysophospholipid acyltransferase family protein [Gammaproteobacteria bacterium]|nr:lysophospholipid acyltransferase family protein [Gammaproteobacteria bacterium]